MQINMNGAGSSSSTARPPGAPGGRATHWAVSVQTESVCHRAALSMDATDEHGARQSEPGGHSVLQQCRSTWRRLLRPLTKQLRDRLGRTGSLLQHSGGETGSLGNAPASFTEHPGVQILATVCEVLCPQCAARCWKSCAKRGSRETQKQSGRRFLHLTCCCVGARPYFHPHLI